MNAVTAFRLLFAFMLITSGAAALVIFFPGELSEDWTILREWNGDGAIWAWWVPPESGWGRTLYLGACIVLLVFYLAVYAGMFLFWRFARTGYALSFVAFSLLPFLDGLAVMLPLEYALLQLVLLAEGAILAMAYLSPVKERFEARKAPATIEVVSTEAPAQNGPNNAPRDA